VVSSLELRQIALANCLGVKILYFIIFNSKDFLALDNFQKKIILALKNPSAFPKFTPISKL
jgi:hypothetical protein